MTFTEILFIILAALAFLAIPVLILLTFCVKNIKRNRVSVALYSQGLLIFGAIMLTLFFCVKYDLSVRDTVACALLAFAGALALCAVLTAVDALPSGRRHKVSLLTASVVLIVLTLQIAVNVADTDGGEAPSFGMAFATIVSQTFQYFSLDAEYTEIIAIGLEVFPLGARYVFYVLACAMTVFAPIVGGFAIFGVLGHFFPHIVLWRNVRSTKYVFSELNKYSIETAESIATLKNELISDPAARKKYMRAFGKQQLSEIMHSAIIFTGVYPDKTNEVDSKLIERASNINAICLKDDITSRKIYWAFGALYRAITKTRKKLVYFLMDSADFIVSDGAEQNLQTAVALLSTEKNKKMWQKTHWWQSGMKAQDVEMYVFSPSGNADSIIGDAFKVWRKDYMRICSQSFPVSGRESELTSRRTELSAVRGADIKKYAERLSEKSEVTDGDETNGYLTNEAGDKPSRVYSPNKSGTGSAETDSFYAVDSDIRALRRKRYRKYVMRAKQQLIVARKNRIIIVGDGVSGVAAHISAFAVNPAAIGEVVNDLYEACEKCESLEDAVGEIEKIIKIANPNLSVVDLRVVCKTINEYQNLVYGLIGGRADGEKCYPLYTGLKRDDGTYDTERLTVLVLGGGRISKTFIKSVFWCGQMLNGDKPTELRIAVMSMDADDTESELRYEMPEAFDDSKINYSQNRDSYCEFRFTTCRFGTKEFTDELTKYIDGSAWGKSKHKGVDFDYVLVALGADNLNMQAADFLTRQIAICGNGNGGDIPINYVIEDNALCAALCTSRHKKNCVLNPFGSLKDRFAFDNIFITDFEHDALIADSTHGGGVGKLNFLGDGYSRNSSIAVGIHTQYKRICIDFSAPDYAGRVYWLEHRRWCAYIRSIGFHCHTAEEFADIAVRSDGAGGKRIVAKDVPLKMHACLVETSDRLYTTQAIRNLLQNNPDFFPFVFKTLQEISSGKNSKIKTVHQLCELLIDKYKCTELDDLDIISALVSRVKRDETGAITASVSNYKDFDITIIKQLQQNFMGDRVRDSFLEKRYPDALTAAQLAAELFADDFAPDYNGRCKNNDNVIYRKGNLFVHLTHLDDYALLVWRTNRCSLENCRFSELSECMYTAQNFKLDPKGFILASEGINNSDYACAIVGVPVGKTLTLLDSNDDKFTLSVGLCENYQRIINVSNPY